jgi:hypothetical protein
MREPLAFVTTKAESLEHPKEIGRDQLADLYHPRHHGRRFRRYSVEVFLPQRTADFHHLTVHYLGWPCLPDSVFAATKKRAMKGDPSV